MCRLTVRKRERKRRREAERDRETGRQAGRQAGRQTDRVDTLPPLGSPGCLCPQPIDWPGVPEPRTHSLSARESVAFSASREKPAAVKQRVRETESQSQRERDKERKRERETCRGEHERQRVVLILDSHLPRRTDG